MKLTPGLFLLAVAVLAVVFFLKLTDKPSPPPIAVVRPPASNPPPSLVVSSPAPSIPQAVTPVGVKADRVTIDAEVDRLSTWAAQGDSRSLSNVVADLASPEKEIRLAAIDAAGQSGNATLIPALKAALVNTTDSEEQEALMDAVEFLSLPPVDLTASGSPGTTERVPVKPHSERLAQVPGQ